MNKKTKYFYKFQKTRYENYSYSVDFLQKFFDKNPIEYRKIGKSHNKNPYYYTASLGDGSMIFVITGTLILPFYETEEQNSGVITYHRLRILVDEETFELYKNNFTNPYFDSVKSGKLLSDVAGYKWNFFLNVHLVFDEWNPFPYIYENKNFEKEHKRRWIDQKLLENMKNGINKKQLIMYFQMMKWSEQMQKKLKKFHNKILSNF